MPAKTISQLTQATTIASGDEFAIEQSGVTKRIAASVVRGDIANANISASAAIAYSKLSLANSIVAADLTANSVTTAKITDANVTTAKIADANVTTAKIADSNVTTAKIADANITAAKLDGAQSGSAPIYGCRAWVNFDGTKDTTGAASTANTNRLIRASGNVTSVKREAAGSYTVTFTTAMPDANYAPSGLAGDPPTGTATLILFGNANPSTTELRVSVMNTSAQGVDRGTVSVAVIR